MTRTNRPEDGLKYYTDEELTLKQMHDDIERRYHDSSTIKNKQYGVFGSLSAPIVNLANPAYISPANLTLTYPGTYTIITSDSTSLYEEYTRAYKDIDNLLTMNTPAEPMSLLMQEILDEEEAKAGRNDYDRIMVHMREKKERVPFHQRNLPKYEKARHAK